MALKPFPYRPVGGLNMEEAEDQLGPEEVQQSANFLFERKRFLNRPSATLVSATGFTGNITYGRSIRFDSFFPITVLISSNGKLYHLVFEASATEITGPATTFGPTEHHNLEAVNGVIIIGNNTTGMLRWDPVGSIYTIMDATRSNFRYVTSHLFRAVGAYKLDGAVNDARRVGWSQSGDETLWTGGDSGNADLVDAPDDATGLEVLYNTLVICRRGGFTLGFPTYTSLPVYRFENWGRELCHGVHYDSTLDMIDNVLYYCSQGNVCTFDLQRINFIGDKIRRELFAYLKEGILFRGFCSKSSANTLMVADTPVRLQYHLVPISNTNRYPHFVYDIKEQTWSRHTYDYPVFGGYYAIITETLECPAVFSGAQTGFWATDRPCEAAAYLVSRSFTLETEEFDCVVRRILLKCRNYGINVITTAVRARVNDTLEETVDLQAIGTPSADQKLVRKWFNHAQAGQNFEIRLEIPKNMFFEGTYLGLLYDISGEFKGDAGT
jgi:hypothetical protein